MNDDVVAALTAMEAFGRAGLTVSVCCGPCGPSPCRWSVQVLSREGEQFERPFAAESFAHAVAIAGVESVRRGWLGVPAPPSTWDVTPPVGSQGDPPDGSPEDLAAHPWKRRPPAVDYNPRRKT